MAGEVDELERDVDPGAHKPSGADGDGKPAGVAGKKKDAKDPGHKQAIIVIVSIIGVVISWLIYRSMKGGTAASPAAASGVAGSGTVAGTSTDTQDPYSQQGFQNYLANLSGEIGGLNSSIGTLSGQIGSTAPGSTSSPVSSGSNPAKFTVHGAANQKESLRSIAASLLPAGRQSDPNAVETELRALNAANPSLKNQTTFLGGHQLVLPSGSIGSVGAGGYFTPTSRATTAQPAPGSAIPLSVASS